MPNYLGVDYGTKRTGVAVTDELQIIASGLTTVNTQELMTFVNDYLEQEKVELILVGEPKQRDGSHSNVEEEIQKFLKRLRTKFPNMPIEREDERFTSKMAFQAMIDSGLKKKQRRNKALIDEIAATIILQDYLNRIQ